MWAQCDVEEQLVWPEERSALILTSLPLPKKLQSTLLPHHFPKLLLLIHWAIWVHVRQALFSLWRYSPFFLS